MPRMHSTVIRMMNEPWTREGIYHLPLSQEHKMKSKNITVELVNSPIATPQPWLRIKLDDGTPRYLHFQLAESESVERFMITLNGFFAAINVSNTY